MTSQRTCLTESWIISLTRKQTWLTSNLFLLAWIIFFTGGLRGRRLWGLSGLSPSFPFGALPLFFSLAVSSSCCLAIICSRWTLQGRRTVSQWAYHHLNSTSIKTKSMTCKNLAKGLVKKYRGVGRSREGVGHEVLSLVQGVGRAIFSYPQGWVTLFFTNY